MRQRSRWWVVVALAAALGLPAPAAAQRGASAARPGDGKGFIWTIEREGRRGWLVGSLHLLPPDAYPLPSAMEEAFTAADVLVEEADPDELSDPAAAAELLKRAFFPAGQSLQGSVSPETFRTLVERAAKAGLTAQAIQTMRPWMVAVTLAAVEMQRSGFDGALGLDKHFRDRAKAAGKPLRTVETALEQIAMLESLGPTLQDALVAETLRGSTSEITQARSLYDAWRAGDADRMAALLLDGARESPEIHQVLFVARNRRWLPKVEACIATSSCMVVVGAGHLVGPDGLLALLRARGYRVQQR